MERFVISRLACLSSEKKIVGKKAKHSYLDERFSSVMVVVDIGSKSLEYLEDGGPSHSRHEAESRGSILLAAATR